MFIVFAVTFLKEKLAWNYLVAFAFLGVTAFFAFAFKSPAPAATTGQEIIPALVQSDLLPSDDGP